MENKDNTQTKNWVCLTKNVKSKSELEKEEHIFYLMKRRNEHSLDKKPEFMNLILCIRTLCIIKAYFPNGSKYEKDICEIKSHPGWNDFMTPYERILLNDFQSALTAIEKNKNTKKFDIVDRKFGTYRYNKWLESQK